MIGKVLVAAGLVAAAPAFAGDVGVVKGPWYPIYLPDNLSVPTTAGPAVGTVRGGVAAEAGAGVPAAAGAESAGQVAMAIPAGADRAALLRLRQALAEEAARRGLR